MAGRILQAFEDQADAANTTPLKGAAYSITSDGEVFRGSPSQMILLSSTEGMLTFEGSESARQSYDDQQRNDTLRFAAHVCCDVTIQLGTVVVFVVEQPLHIMHVRLTIHNEPLRTVAQQILNEN